MSRRSLPLAVCSGVVLAACLTSGLLAQVVAGENLLRPNNGPDVLPMGTTKGVRGKST